MPEAYAIWGRIATLCLRLRAQVLSDADEPTRRYVTALDHTWRAVIDWSFRAARYNREGGDPDGRMIQTFPGWAAEPADSSLEPLSCPSIAWWWDELR